MNLLELARAVPVSLAAVDYASGSLLVAACLTTSATFSAVDWRKRGWIAVGSISVACTKRIHRHDHSSLSLLEFY